jgi:hypothetical protein
VIGEVIVAVLGAVVADELTGGSRWAAARISGWAARRIYCNNAERAAERTEEWAALISTTLPTNLAALCFGLGLAASAIAFVTARYLGHVGSALRGTRAELPAFLIAEHDRREHLVETKRVACLGLLTEVSQLRLRAEKAATVPAKEIDLYLVDVRDLAAQVQLAAANVAILAPQAQAAASRLAEAAMRVADAMAAERTLIQRRRIRPPRFSELDETARAFLQAAIDLHTDVIP